MRETTRLDIRLRIDFGSVSALGPGKVALLEHIERAGALSQAARELGLSYRRAWQLLDDLNHSFRDPVASASVGGVGGGGVQLTAFAKELIAAYRRVESAALNATRTQGPQGSGGSFARSLIATDAARERVPPHPWCVARRLVLAQGRRPAARGRALRDSAGLAEPRARSHTRRKGLPGSMDGERLRAARRACRAGNACRPQPRRRRHQCDGRSAP